MTSQYQVIGSDLATIRVPWMTTPSGATISVPGNPALTQIGGTQSVLMVWMQDDNSIQFAICAGTPCPPSDWMRFMQEVTSTSLVAPFGQLPLRRITLPGSHDAGMYKVESIKTHFGVSNATTQSNTLYGQLCSGARWFDLRPAIETQFDNPIFQHDHLFFAP